MAKVEANISMSLDGFVTGPNLNRYLGLGEGGETLHAWTGESRAMDFAMGEERQIAGSIITSRKVYDETEGWRAENGFYRMPVFVVTHRPHDVVVRGETTFTFVTVVFTCVGGVVATRRPTNPVGWIFGMMGLGGPIQYVNRRVRAQGDRDRSGESPGGALCRLGPGLDMGSPHRSGRSPLPALSPRETVDQGIEEGGRCGDVGVRGNDFLPCLSPPASGFLRFGKSRGPDEQPGGH
jgi:hypothetical protein